MSVEMAPALPQEWGEAKEYLVFLEHKITLQEFAVEKLHLSYEQAYKDLVRDVRWAKEYGTRVPSGIRPGYPIAILRTMDKMKNEQKES